MDNKTTYKVNFQEETTCNKYSQDGDGEESPSRHYTKPYSQSPWIIDMREVTLRILQAFVVVDY